MFDKEKRIQTVWFVGVCSSSGEIFLSNQLFESKGYFSTFCPIVINLLFVYIFVVLVIENNSKKYFF